MADKEQTAIMRLQTASAMSLQYYNQPLVITTSGGKDSSVCVELAIRAGIPFEVMHSHTTADAPETVYFVRSEFKRLESMGIKCTINKPVYKGAPTSMWSLIPQKLIPPTRLVRYCCSVLKEQGGLGASSPPASGGMNRLLVKLTVAYMRKLHPKKRKELSSTMTTTTAGCFLKTAA